MRSGSYAQLMHSSRYGSISRGLILTNCKWTEPVKTELSSANSKEGSQDAQAARKISLHILAKEKSHLGKFPLGPLSQKRKQTYEVTRGQKQLCVCGQ